MVLAAAKEELQMNQSISASNVALQAVVFQVICNYPRLMISARLDQAGPIEEERRRLSLVLTPISNP